MVQPNDFHIQEAIRHLLHAQTELMREAFTLSAWHRAPIRELAKGVAALISDIDKMRQSEDELERKLEASLAQEGNEQR